MGERGVQINSKFLALSNWKPGDGHHLRWARDSCGLGEVLGTLGLRLPSGDVDVLESPGWGSRKQGNDLRREPQQLL